MKNIITIIIVTCIALWAATQLIAAKYVATAVSMSLYVIVPAVAFWVAAIAVGGPIGKIGAFLTAGRESRSASKAKESAAKKIAAEAKRIGAEARRIDREADVNIRKIEIETKRIEAEVWVKLAEARRIAAESRHRTISGRHVVVLDNHTGRVQQYLAPPRKVLTEERIEEGSNQTAIDVGLEIDRAFVWGPTRGGKTFFCKQLSYHLAGRGDIVFAIDPKDFDPDDPWPGGVQVVGQADNFDEIARFWDWVDAEKARRGKDMRAAKRMPKIYIIFDEINDAVYERPEFADKYIRVLRKYAQYRINIICVGQTDTVDSIGLRGLNQLKKCFDVVLGFQRDRTTDGFKSFVDYGDGKKVDLVPYRPIAVNAVNAVNGNGYGNWGDVSGFDDTSSTSETSDTSKSKIYYLPSPPSVKHRSIEHKMIYEAFRSGRTIYFICKNVLDIGNGNPNYKPSRRDYDYVRNVLALYGNKERRS
jgi:hypothetical protein